MNREDYARYMTSDRWRHRRQRFIATTSGACPCGETTDLHVHHATYDNFQNELDCDLRLVCQRCHSEIHAIHEQIGGDLATITDRVLAVVAQAAVKADTGSSRPKRGKPLPWEMHRAKRNRRRQPT